MCYQYWLKKIIYKKVLNNIGFESNFESIYIDLTASVILLLTNTTIFNFGSFKSFPQEIRISFFFKSFEKKIHFLHTWVGEHSILKGSLRASNSGLNENENVDFSNANQSN